MQPPRQHSRINLAELKAQIVKKLGPESSKQYFYYLNRFLSLKLTKVEFNKLCLRILGRDNIPLHNQLVRSILRNACTSKEPPPPPPPTTHSASKDTQNVAHAIATALLSNGGDILPLSPRKARTASRDRKVNRSTLGKSSSAVPPHQSSDLENGDLEKERRSSPELLAFRGNDDDDDDDDDGKELSPLRAPLGVPLCPVSIGGVRRVPPPPSGRFTDAFVNDGVLLDSLTLRDRMERIALEQGLEGVSLDCAEILNHGLDSYMKGLLRSCIELVGSRSGHVLAKEKQQSHVKLINGMKPGYQYQMQNSGKLPLEAQEDRSQFPTISLQDFRVAMELNPRKLGEDWPLLLEKICTDSFEE